jgi:hypothetical protein
MMAVIVEAPRSDTKMEIRTWADMYFFGSIQLGLFPLNANLVLHEGNVP